MVLCCLLYTSLVLDRPELVVEEETIDFKVQERKSDKLYLGETRILQEGKQGVRLHLIEVENGKRQLKEDVYKRQLWNKQKRKVRQWRKKKIKL